MEESALLNHLQTLEEDSAAFVWGALGNERERAQKEYFRMPYGNEEDGWSSIVTRSSPRPWGCFLVGELCQLQQKVFPTPVGVFLKWTTQGR